MKFEDFIETHLEKLIVAVGILFILAIPVAMVFDAYMEAKAYNSITGSNVSTWDAMWVELRVQDTPKQPSK